MSNNNDFFYNLLPELYRTSDTNGQLQKFLSVFYEFGLKFVQDKTLFLHTAIEPNTCDSSLIPILCESVGIPFYADIPDRFQRKLLSNISEMYKRKGTASVVEYLARELSGCSARLSPVDTSGFVKYYNLQLVLSSPSESTITDSEVIQRYAKLFLPLNVEIGVTELFAFFEITNEIVNDSFLKTVIHELSTDTVTEITEDSEQGNIEISYVQSIEDAETINKDFSCVISFLGVARLNDNFKLGIINGIDVITENGIRKVEMY